MRFFGGGSDPLGGVAVLVEPSSGVVVLDRGADRAGISDAGDGQRCARRVGAVAVLEID